MKMIDDTYHWYAIYTRSRFEKQIYQNLQKTGIKSYLPLKISKKKWSDRLKFVEEPVLRGYLFVCVSNKEYYQVLNSVGVVSYVKFSGEVAEIPEKQINDLRLFVEQMNDLVQVTNERLVKGERVRISVGPMAGLEGIIADFRGKKRLVLSFKQLGCSFFAEIPTDQIVKTKLESATDC